MPKGKKKSARHPLWPSTVGLSNLTPWQTLDIECGAAAMRETIVECLPLIDNKEVKEKLIGCLSYQAGNRIQRKLGERNGNRDE